MPSCSECGQEKRENQGSSFSMGRGDWLCYDCRYVPSSLGKDDNKMIKRIAIMLEAFILTMALFLVAGCGGITVNTTGDGVSHIPIGVPALTLTARHYYDGVSVDQKPHIFISYPITHQVRVEIPVTHGSGRSEHKAILSIGTNFDGNGTITECTYAGYGRSYYLESCTNGIRAYDLISSSYFKLVIENGESGDGYTELMAGLGIY